MTAQPVEHTPEKVCHVCQQGRRHGVLEVDQPAIEAIVLHDATELLSKALCKALQGEQLQALDCAGCPLGDEGSQHLRLSGRATDVPFTKLAQAQRRSFVS